MPDAARPRDAGPDAKDAAPIPGELEGWVRWDDYDPKCNFSIPSERKYLPEPFEWEPCQDTDVTRKLACRRIKKKCKRCMNPTSLASRSRGTTGHDLSDERGARAHRGRVARER